MELVIVLAAVAIAIPLALISAADMYKRHLAFKQRELELQADRTAEQSAQYAAQVERLEERMRVLERIATDKGADLALQIEELRETPRAAIAAGERSN